MSEHRQLFNIQDLRDVLAERNYKLTPQRKEILQIFVESGEEKHLSAEKVHELLQQKNFDFGIATVYRNVELLTKLGILTKVDFGDGCARYELNAADPKIHQHHHLICLNCKKIIEFNEDLLEHLEFFIEKNYDFKIVNHELKFFGYCSDCKNKVTR